VVQNREAAALGEDTAQAWCYSGVVLAFYSGWGSVGEEMPVGNGRGFMADAIDVRGGC
jgi:hypothetical protein